VCRPSELASHSCRHRILPKIFEEPLNLVPLVA
jgi:hypothetical protein